MNAWQARQAAECPCRGVDDYCPCQNVDRTLPPMPDSLARLEAAIVAGAKESPTGVYGECVVRIGDLRRVIEAAKQ